MKREDKIFRLSGLLCIDFHAFFDAVLPGLEGRPAGSHRPRREAFSMVISEPDAVATLPSPMPAAEGPGPVWTRERAVSE